MLGVTCVHDLHSALSSSLAAGTLDTDRSGTWPFAGWPARCTHERDTRMYGFLEPVFKRQKCKTAG